MAIPVVLGLAFFILTAGFAVLALDINKKKGFVKKNGNKKIVFIGLALLSFAIFISVPFSFHTVNAGEIAVVKYLGKATDVRTPGTYFDFWVTKKYDIYDAKVQNLDIDTAAYSKDAQSMDIQMTVQYQIDQSKVVEIANDYGSLDILTNRIMSISIEKAKSCLSSHSAMTIIDTRSTISPLVEKSIKETVDENYYINIVAVVITDIVFTEAFERTVEEKMIAEQEKLKAEYEKATAIVNAEKELEVAKLQAQARIEGAKADAEAQIEAARAEAMAIQMKSIEVARALGFEIIETIVQVDGVDTITYDIDFTGKTEAEIKLITDYLKYLEYLSKWDGKLPEVLVTDGNAQIIIPSP